ncbi:MAG: molybdopterin-dependent oxidoreductase [Candidatus Bathyarchaeia archaeon]
MKLPSLLLENAKIIVILVVLSLLLSLIPVATSASNDNEWKLTVTGLVEHPLNLSLVDIIALPKTTICAQLICVGPPPFVVTEGNWTGVRLRLLLEQATVIPGAIKIAFYSQDSYTTDLPIDTAQHDDVILAYAKDGKPLSEVLRLVVPGKWGYKWISQLTQIEIVDYDLLGRWESQGYSDEADISQGAPNVRDFQSSFITPFSTLAPVTSPTPSPYQPPVAPQTPSQEPMPSLDTTTDSYLPFETIHVKELLVITIVLFFGVIIVRKRSKRPES